MAGVVGVRHQEGGAAPVEEDDLVEHERGALQQAVLQLPAEQAPALLQDEGSLALLQVQLLQQTLALSLGGYEDLGLNIKSGSERREERGETDLGEESCPGSAAQPVLEVGCDDG